MDLLGRFSVIYFLARFDVQTHRRGMVFRDSIKRAKPRLLISASSPDTNPGTIPEHAPIPHPHAPPTGLPRAQNHGTKSNTRSQVNFGDSLDVSFCEGADPILNGVQILSFLEGGDTIGLGHGEAIKLFSLFYNLEAKGNELFEEIEVSADGGYGITAIVSVMNRLSPPPPRFCQAQRNLIS